VGATADIADRRRHGRRPALTPGELAQFPQALCQSRQPSPKPCGCRPALTPGELAQFPQALCQSRQPPPLRCGCRPALTPGELAQFPQALCQTRQPSPKRWWPKHWSPARGCQYCEVGGWPRCRSSVDECRQVYATTLLRSVKRKVAAASKIILSHRQGGRGAAASAALA
jgi:hypothetical protein